ncbi:unnamed protein product, partial [Ectocarpus sp. 12 AP-2014]
LLPVTLVKIRGKIEIRFWRATKMCGCNPRRSVDDAIVLGGVRFNWKFSSMQSEKK